jgi:hypothetical protein
MENSMHPIIRPFALATLALTLTLPASAQTRTGVMGDLIKDVDGAQGKLLGLAKALPAGAYDWRPGKGARSTGEVFIHIIAENYFLPAAMGSTPPPDTGIVGTEYKTVTAFEGRKMTRDEILAGLEKSFAFLKSSMTAMPDPKLEEPLQVFGQKTTNRSMWISTATHLHEHLGQLIAYARSNNVTPPWSK